MQIKSIAECSKGGNSGILLTFIKLPFVIKNLCLVYFRVADLRRFYCNSNFTIIFFFIWTYVLFQYRAWSRPEYINQTSVSLRTGSEVIDYFADYFGIGYPLPKEGEKYLQ